MIITQWTSRLGGVARVRARRRPRVAAFEPLEGRQLLHAGGGAHHAREAYSAGAYRDAARHRAAEYAAAERAEYAAEHARAAGRKTGKPAAIAGAWTPPIKFKPPGAREPYLAIHSTVLPNGLVLAWPHDYRYFLSTKRASPATPNIILWNPETNRYHSMTLPRTNLFCSGHAFLPDGRLLVLGGHGPAEYPVDGLQTTYGHNHAELYDFRTDKWKAGPDMAEGRYYGSAITLGTGEVLVVAGYDEESRNAKSIEIFKDGEGWRALAGASTKKFPDWYPHIYQLSNGLVFGANPGKRTFLLDPTGKGKIWKGPKMRYRRRYYGASVMYDQDKIIAIGGNSAPGTAGIGGNNLITRTAEIIDMASPNPKWKYTKPMKYARFFPNATLLPDGTVLVTGGTRQQSNESGNALAGAVYQAELWNPATGKWTGLASMSVPRLYHSTAVLLPDARVLVAGGGQPESTGEVEGTIHDTMQIYSPPYLFKGPRPTIASAPTVASYGQTITVTSPDANSIAQINLIEPGSTTHGFNMTQRIAKLSFTRDPDGNLQVQMPTNPNAAPPGYYMLFLLNAEGVPSKASMIQLM